MTSRKWFRTTVSARQAADVIEAFKSIKKPPQYYTEDLGRSKLLVWTWMIREQLQQLEIYDQDEGTSIKTFIEGIQTA